MPALKVLARWRGDSERDAELRPERPDARVIVPAQMDQVEPRSAAQPKTTAVINREAPVHQTVSARTALGSEIGRGVPTDGVMHVGGSSTDGEQPGCSPAGAEHQTRANGEQKHIVPGRGDVTAADGAAKGPRDIFHSRINLKERMRAESVAHAQSGPVPEIVGAPERDSLDECRGEGVLRKVLRAKRNGDEQDRQQPSHDGWTWPARFRLPSPRAIMTYLR